MAPRSNKHRKPKTNPLSALAPTLGNLNLGNLNLSGLAPSGPAARTAATLTAAAAASVAVIAEPGHADAAEPAPAADQVSSQHDRLPVPVETAPQDIEQATARIQALHRRAAAIERQLTRTEAALAAARSGLSAIAAAQYRDGGFSATMQLTFSAHPEHYLEQSGTLSRVADAERRVLDHYGQQDRALAEERNAAEAALARLTAERQRLTAAKATVDHKLAQAHHLLLPTDATPSSLARTALAFARAQLGKPYSWGASGPDAFDCSGLTEQAWAAAGVTLPRTTEKQLTIGQRVPLNSLAPGDLVFYYSGATHVALYAGAGQIIHAPHPGAPVRYAPLHSMPITATTRPA